MHETVLASSLLNILAETVARHTDGGKKLHVVEVELTVGLLASLEPQTLRGCFALMAEGTIAENALLTIVTRPMKGLCPDCGAAVETVRRNFSCPACNGGSVDWQEGQGMEITSVKVAEAVQPQEGEYCE